MEKMIAESIFSNKYASLVKEALNNNKENPTSPEYDPTYQQQMRQVNDYIAAEVQKLIANPSYANFNQSLTNLVKTLGYLYGTENRASNNVKIVYQLSMTLQELTQAEAPQELILAMNQLKDVFEQTWTTIYNESESKKNTQPVPEPLELAARRKNRMYKPI